MEGNLRIPPNSPEAERKPQFRAGPIPCLDSVISVTGKSENVLQALMTSTVLSVEALFTMTISTSTGGAFLREVTTESKHLVTNPALLYVQMIMEI